MLIRELFSYTETYKTLYIIKDSLDPKTFNGNVLGIFNTSNVSAREISSNINRTFFTYSCTDPFWQTIQSAKFCFGFLFLNKNVFSLVNTLNTDFKEKNNGVSIEVLYKEKFYYKRRLTNIEISKVPESGLVETYLAMFRIVYDKRHTNELSRKRFTYLLHHFIRQYSDLEHLDLNISTITKRPEETDYQLLCRINNKAKDKYRAISEIPMNPNWFCFRIGLIKGLGSLRGNPRQTELAFYFYFHSKKYKSPFPKNTPEAKRPIPTNKFRGKFFSYRGEQKSPMLINNIEAKLITRPCPFPYEDKFHFDLNSTLNKTDPRIPVNTYIIHAYLFYFHREYCLTTDTFETVLEVRTFNSTFSKEAIKQLLVPEFWEEISERSENYEVIHYDRLMKFIALLERGYIPFNEQYPSTILEAQYLQGGLDESYLGIKKGARIKKLLQKIDESQEKI